MATKKCQTKDEIRGVKYLFNFIFTELGFHNEFLETELFTFIYESSEVDRALRMIKRTGWKFDRKLSGPTKWIWRKPYRTWAQLDCLPPDVFIFRFNGFNGLIWGYDLNSRRKRTVSEKEWKEMEIEASSLSNPADRY